MIFLLHKHCYRRFHLNGFFVVFYYIKENFHNFIQWSCYKTLNVTQRFQETWASRVISCEGYKTDKLILNIFGVVIVYERLINHMAFNRHGNSSWAATLTFRYSLIKLPLEITEKFQETTNIVKIDFIQEQSLWNFEFFSEELLRTPAVKFHR